MTVSQTFLVLDYLHSFDQHWSECRMSSNLGLSVGVMGFRREDHRGECHFHHITYKVCAYHMASLMMPTLTTWLRQGVPGFSAIKSHFPSAILSLISKAHTHSGELSSTSFSKVSLHQLFAILL